MTIRVRNRIVVDGIESIYFHSVYEDNESVYRRKMIQILPDFGDHGKNGECDCFGLFSPRAYPTGIHWPLLKKEMGL